MNTKVVGNLTELQCITRLYELGGKVSIPFGNSEKYDFILDFNGMLYKVQCKHCKEEFDNFGNVSLVKFKTTWQSHNTSGYKTHHYDEGEVDYFATYYNGECYLIPYSECSNHKRLRIKRAKNNQKSKISYLDDYEAKKVLQNTTLLTKG